MTYIATEPETIPAYEDQTGKLHRDRDAALEANFKDDLRAAVVSLLQKERYEDMPALNTLHFVRDFITTNPDLARILVGDRDLT